MRNSLLLAVFLALMGSTLSGCYTVKYTSKRPGGGERKVQKKHFFLWGLVPTHRVNLRELCPNGIARWQNQQTFGDGLAGCCTLGIWVPRTIVVECAGNRVEAMTDAQLDELQQIADSSDVRVEVSE